MRWYTAHVLAAVVVLFPVLARGEITRIISLAPSITEIVFALGAGDRLVGVSTYCDYPPAAAKIARVGTFLTPNVEAIIARRPDVVLAVPSPGNRSAVETLRRLGLHVVVASPLNVAGILHSIRIVGRAIERSTAAESLVRDTEKHLASVRARVSGAERPRVMIVVGQTPLLVVGAGNYLDELIAMAGGRNIGAQAGGGWPHISIEFALAAQPEIIIDTTMGNERQSGAGLEFWKKFPELPAVVNGRVFGVGESRLLRPGPRVGQALDLLARYIHPERFSGAARHEERKLVAGSRP